MTGTELFDKIAEHAELEGVGILETDKGPAVMIKHTPSGMATQFPLEAIETLGWGVLEPVLTGQRDPNVLTHMSRIVGYFSRLANWSKSKIGELKDRHKGSYALEPEAQAGNSAQADRVLKSY